MFNLLALASLSEKNTSGFIGGVHPPLGATETTFHSSEKWKFLMRDTWDNFHKTCKKSFLYLKERGQKLKKLVKGVYTPHKIFSH